MIFPNFAFRISLSFFASPQEFTIIIVSLLNLGAIFIASANAWLGSKLGILHGAAAYVCQNSEGQINETDSISAGLDYPGVSPIHCFLKDTKRARYTSASDEEALNAYKMVTKFEKINPSLEPSHAFAEAIKIAPKLSKDTIIIVNSCGDAKKDKDIIKKRLGKY